MISTVAMEIENSKEFYNLKSFRSFKKSKIVTTEYV